MRYFLAAMALPLGLNAQPFAIGNRSLDLFDAARNRTVATQVYYPASVAGANAAVALGSFPVLVFGHGFVMSTGAYGNLWNHFVPKGYIMALPTTEAGIPDHAAFGQDLAFVAQAMQAAGADAGSPFFGRVAPATALMGHSMGGGASLLGAAGNSAITTVVDLAPAETNPSAVAACASVLVPTLIFAGTNDCVTPIAQHTAPMYDALAPSCRAFVRVLGGGHCYFADYNFNCAFGELTCSPAPAIKRAQQHSVVNDLAGLWLDHHLRGDAAAWSALLDSLAGSTRISAEHTCALATGWTTQEEARWRLFPNPALGAVRLEGLEPGAAVSIVDAIGREVLRASPFAGRSIDADGLRAGAYLVRVRQHDRWTVRMLHILPR
jgi:pimeloyl-ACP methyl ester carboxylesterase